MAQLAKNLPALWETWVRSLGWEDSLEKGMATHSNILAWSHKESDTTEQLSLTQYLPCARRDERHKKNFAVHFTNSGARNAYASEILRQKNHRI